MKATKTQLAEPSFPKDYESKTEFNVNVAISISCVLICIWTNEENVHYQETVFAGKRCPQMHLLHFVQALVSGTVLMTLLESMDIKSLQELLSFRSGQGCTAPAAQEVRPHSTVHLEACTLQAGTGQTVGSESKEAEPSPS